MTTCAMNWPGSRHETAAVLDISQLAFGGLERLQFHHQAGMLAAIRDALGGRRAG